jgi:hypothetical protein
MKFLSARTGDRHSHISIGLQYRCGQVWERIEALGWNEVGFNFYSAQEIKEPLLELKRGLSHFEGTMVWSSLNTSDEVVLAELVNELIYKKTKDVANNEALHARLVKLLRTPGLIAEKKSLLGSLGLSISDEKMVEMIEQRRLEHPIFRYGVKVCSPVWSAIVQNALSISSVVISMEKWSDALSKD